MQDCTIAEFNTSIVVGDSSSSVTDALDPSDPSSLIDTTICDGGGVRSNANWLRARCSSDTLAGLRSAWTDKLYAWNMCSRIDCLVRNNLILEHNKKNAAVAQDHPVLLTIILFSLGCLPRVSVLLVGIFGPLLCASEAWKGSFGHFA